ncbi:hypothetical protein R2B67_26190 [Streptomyces cyaneofuscatus]|uniref:hypothetical protein n=1 Tax=Streptomyces cyaneofuscatus TaxID=66883 RepID=UPI002952CBA0|nr:hypothetical protein [Streptomyces cyaneofuscatus]WOP11811.1 hypothetical protein R2B67_26190 [Streptomyces cyaneofuscatus]
MTPLQRAGRRLADGHRRQTARITSWVTEKGESTSTAARSAVLIAAAYIAWKAEARTPIVLWVLIAAWVIAAWRAAPKPPTATPETPRDAIVQWLTETIGDRPGIHLYELYPAMRLLPGMARHDDTALRGALTELDIPITRSLTIGDIKGRSGVRLADLTTPLPPPEEHPLSQGKDAGETGRSTPEEQAETGPSPAEERTTAA